jgi:predicted nucleotidyltransferase
MHTDDNPLLKALLSSSARISLLQVLLLDPGEGFYLRKLEAKTGFAPRTIQLELNRLSHAGILKRTDSGNRVYYRINEDCPIIPELRSIFIKTVGVADVLRRALEPHGQDIQAALIYGSFAASVIGPDSDVDVMVVGDIDFGDVVRALQPAQQELNREVNPTVYPPDEIRRRILEKDHFVTSVMEGPKIFLLGSEDELRGLAE